MLKFHDLAHAAHWHAPVHAHQFTKLQECDMHEPEMPSEEDMFHMADFDGSGTVSAEGLCGRLCPTHEPLPLRIFPETLPLARRRPVF